MDYPLKTLSQLRPILQGFRKSAGLTQAVMASHLGVTQQTYAQLEANPTAISIERLFKVLRVLNVDLTLRQAGDATRAAPPADPGRAASIKQAPAVRRTRATRITQDPVKQARTTKPAKASASPTADTRRATGKANAGSRKRESW